MDKLEQITKRRIKTAKVGGVLLILSSICALVIFILNAMDIINIFHLAEYESHRLMQLSTIGTCVLGIITGILCLGKINNPDWYGIINVFCIITVIFNVFIVVGHATSFNNMAATIIIFIIAICACICAHPVNRLKASATKL